MYMYRLCNTEHNMHYAACCSVCSSPSSNPAPTSRCPQETGPKVDHRRRLVLWHKGSRRDKTSEGERCKHNDTRIHTQYGTHSCTRSCMCVHTHTCAHNIHTHTHESDIAVIACSHYNNIMVMPTLMLAISGPMGQ